MKIKNTKKGTIDKFLSAFKDVKPGTVLILSFKL